VALVRRPQARDPAAKPEDRPQRLENRSGGIWQTGSYDPARGSTSSARAPVPDLRSAARPGDTLTPTRRRSTSNTGKPAWHFRTRRTTPGLRRSRRPLCSTTPRSNGERARSSAIRGRNGSITRSIAPPASFIKGRPVRDDLNWTKGINPKTGRRRLRSEARRADLQSSGAGAARRRKKRACPTWHGGVAAHSRPPTIR